MYYYILCIRPFFLIRKHSDPQNCVEPSSILSARPNRKSWHPRLRFLGSWSLKMVADQRRSEKQIKTIPWSCWMVKEYTLIVKTICLWYTKKKQNFAWIWYFCFCFFCFFYDGKLFHVVARTPKRRPNSSSAACLSKASTGALIYWFIQRPSEMGIIFCIKKKKREKKRISHRNSHFDPPFSSHRKITAGGSFGYQP